MVTTIANRVRKRERTDIWRTVYRRKNKKIRKKDGKFERTKRKTETRKTETERTKR
jgi:hypothetical protein